MPNYEPQTAALWEDLKQLTRSVVEEMNRDADLTSRTGGLEFHFAGSDSIVVIKLSTPQMYLSVRLLAATLDVETRLMLDEEELGDRQFHEELAIQIDESGSSLRSPEGEVFTVDRAVFYVLRPFLHLGAVGC